MRCVSRTGAHMQFTDLGRREFIAVLGSTAAFSLAARARQGERVRRIAVLMAMAANDPEAQARLAAFMQGLQKLGWAVGRNIQVDYRWGGSNADALRRYSEELVALVPDVILAHSSAAVGPLLQASRTIPIVFTIVADPVGAGYVQSLARPGGNITGVTNFEYVMS